QVMVAYCTEIGSRADLDLVPNLVRSDLPDLFSVGANPGNLFQEDRRVWQLQKMVLLIEPVAINLPVSAVSGRKYADLMIVFHQLIANGGQLFGELVPQIVSHFPETQVGDLMPASIGVPTEQEERKQR